MAATITLEIPPGTEVVLPASGSLAKAAGAPLAITLANAAGESLAVGSTGAATKFTVGEVPASIEDSQSDEIPLTVLASGVVSFQYETDETFLSVTVAGAARVPFTDHQQQLRYVRP